MSEQPVFLNLRCPPAERETAQPLLIANSTRWRKRSCTFGGLLMEFCPKLVPCLDGNYFRTAVGAGILGGQVAQEFTGDFARSRNTEHHGAVMSLRMGSTWRRSYSHERFNVVAAADRTNQYLCFTFWSVLCWVYPSNIVQREVPAAAAALMGDRMRLQGRHAAAPCQEALRFAKRV